MSDGTPVPRYQGNEIGVDCGGYASTDCHKMRTLQCQSPLTIECVIMPDEVFKVGHINDLV